MSKPGDAAMLVKIKDKGQVTLPAKTRKRYGLDVGDYVELVEEGNSIRLTPKAIAPRPPAMDAPLKEALEDERAGRFLTATAPGKPKPAVPVRKSVFPDYIVCLEDGMQFK